MTVTTIEIDKIISGEAFPITIPYPLADRGENAKWFIKQPSDWLYDMSIAVMEAAEAEIMALPEMQGAKTLPPSEGWMSLYNGRKGSLETRIKELDDKANAITPEEHLELLQMKDALSNIVDPTRFTRADEIARRETARSRDMWLLPRLIADENGKILFDPSTEEGRNRWNQLGRRYKDELRLGLNVVLGLIQLAKN